MFTVTNQLIKFDGNDYPVAFKPAEIIFPKYDDMKNKVDAIRDEFTEWTVTPENLKSSNNTATMLNTLKKAINQQRISITKKAKKPADDFKKKIDILTAEIDETRGSITSQIEIYEDKLRQRKHEQNVKFIKKACADVGVDFAKITYNSSWDTKSYSNSKFESEVDQQVYILVQNKKNFETNSKIIIEKADELSIPATHYITELRQGNTLDVILEEMTAERKNLNEIAKKQKETKKREQADLIRKGDKAIDPETGEVKEKTYTVTLEFENVTKYQLEQLESFLTDWGIKAKRIK